MKVAGWILGVFIFSQSYHIQAQDSLSYSNTNLTAASITCGTLLTLGLITDQQGNKEDVRKWVRDRFAIPRTSVDDYLQHMSVFMLYGADLIAKRSKQEVGRQSRHLILSETLSIGTALLLKDITNRTRPNGGSRSFPSGHTTHAFTGATVLYYSFRDENKWLAYAGFVPATITGVYRIVKDKHWVSDVLFGAGLGILSSVLVYELNIWNSRIGPDNRQNFTSLQLGVTPSGLGLTLHL